jgi:hypothetical protein
MSQVQLRRLPAILLLAIGPWVAEVHAGPFYGPLRGRDLTPFGFLRLDMRPAHAVAIEPGSWAIEADLGYQNTWALSPGVEGYLTELEAEGRRDLGRAELAAIQQLPGENYLLDVEVSTLDLVFHYRFSPEWSGYAIASAVSYQGGFLDGTIERFHESFGFSSFGRPALRRNDANLIYQLRSAEVVSFGTPTSGGLTDPTLGIRYAGFALPNAWRLSAEAAVKLPVGGERLLLSTGRTDVGLQLSLRHHGERQAWYVNAAAVHYAGTREPAPHESQVIPTLILGYERPLTARTNFNLQAYVSRSVFTERQTDLEELRGTKYQVSAGVRHRVRDMLLTFAVTENLQNINNTPDIGFQLGFAYIPRHVDGNRDRD